MIADIRYHSRGVIILNESISTRPISAPDPTAWRDIFHQKLIIVIIIEINAVANIKDFKKTGIGNLKTM
jgi:hypothetical protein